MRKAEVGRHRVVNISDLTERGAKFVELPGVERIDYSGLPHNTAERLIRRPRLSRYRAAMQGVLAARGDPIISHLPRMTAAVSAVQVVTNRKSPHLAFAFNFTDLPRGASKFYLTRAFQSVEEFFVFSAYERELYSEFFRVPEDRFTQLIWTQDAPVPSAEPSRFGMNNYVSAIGGEGRDYQALISAAERLPSIDFVVIARPYNRLPQLPSNVRLLTNVPLAETWRIAADSSCMVVPLKSRTTCCGHITLVSGELLGVPLISTCSEATREYTEDVALCEPGDAAALAQLIEDHHENANAYKAAAAARVREKLIKYDRRHWDRAIGDAVRRYF